MITTTLKARTVTIETITSENELARACRALGSHYWETDTRRYFSARLLDLWTTPDGAIWVESIQAGFSSSAGRTHKAMQLKIGTEDHDIVKIYSGLDDGARGPTSRRRAIAAARAAREEATR